MSNQDSPHKTVIPLIDGALSQLDDEGIRSFLIFIRSTIIPRNHEAIVDALERAFQLLPNKKRWEVDFKETMVYLLAQKEKADNVTIFIGRLNRFSMGHFLRDLPNIGAELLSSTKIVIDHGADPDPRYFKVTLESSGDHLLEAFDDKSRLSKHNWPNLFEQISGPVLLRN